MIKIYSIKETDGTEWGEWAAESREEALGMLLKDICVCPETYCGFPDINELIINCK